MSPVESFGARIDESRVRRRSRSISNHVRRRVNALRLLRVAPRPQRELEDEELAGLGEEHGRLGLRGYCAQKRAARGLDAGARRDHAHVLVGLHDALDPRERQIVVRLEALLRRDLQLLHVDALLLPELLEERLHLPHVPAQGWARANLAGRSGRGNAGAALVVVFRHLRAGGHPRWHPAGTAAELGHRRESPEGCARDGDGRDDGEAAELKLGATMGATRSIAAI